MADDLYHVRVQRLDRLFFRARPFMPHPKGRGWRVYKRFLMYQRKMQRWYPGADLT